MSNPQNFAKGSPWDGVKPVRIVFFGAPPLKDAVVAELSAAGFLPERIVESVKLPADFVDELAQEEWDVFIVASFGKILPKRLLDIPKHGVINLHPSLLPRLRGPSPIRSAILTDERETGVSIMLLDDKMDHGPLLAQRKVPIPDWPPRGAVLDQLLANEGAKLLATTLPLWLRGEIEPQEQNHDLATYTKFFVKEDGLIDLSADPYQNLLKIRAFDGWPGAYAFFERAGKRIRVQILDAHIENSKLSIDLVKPEGKTEMPYRDFLNSGAKAL